MGDRQGEHTGRLPRVTVHYAQTLDGRIATRGGQSQWISGGPSLELAHQLRASHDAVLVGVGTVVADNPRLTVRLVPGPSPLRVVVDSMLRLPLASNVLTDDAAPTLIATTDRAPAARLKEIRNLGAEVLVVRRNAEGRVDLRCLFQELRGRGLASLLVEGGRGIITTCLRERLASRLVICIAPKLLGSGIEAIGELGIKDLGSALVFSKISFTPLGEDLIFDGQLERAATGWTS